MKITTGTPRAVLKSSIGKNQSGILYSFLIPREEVSKRALLFDSLISTDKNKVFLHSMDDIWDPLINGEDGSCFIIPATSDGNIIPQTILTKFPHRERYE